MPPSTTAAPRRPTASASTQTVGLFYPSDRELAKKQEQEEEKKSFEKQLRDRRPLLTAVSPGKGIGSISGDFSRHDEIDCNAILILISGSLSCLQSAFVLQLLSLTSLWVLCTSKKSALVVWEFLWYYVICNDWKLV